MMEGEEATTGTEVTTGYVVDGAITGAVIKEGVVVTTINPKLLYWNHQLVLNWYHHKPESHQ